MVTKKNNKRICGWCKKEMVIEEGVTIFDKNWYHSQCWKNYDKNEEGKN